jgi:hypothetical protein
MLPLHPVLIETTSKNTRQQTKGRWGVKKLGGLKEGKSSED